MMWCLTKKFQKQVLHKLDRIISLLEKLTIQPVNSFVIIGGLVDINPGQSTILTATPLAAPVPPATVGLPTTLPAGDVPSWSITDPTAAAKVTVKPSTDGLLLAVAVNAGAAPGDVVFVITDAVIANATGTFTLTIPTPVQAPVASFSVSASTPV